MQAIVIFKGYINLQWAAIGEALFIFSEVLCLKTSVKIAPFLKNWGFTCSLVSPVPFCVFNIPQKHSFFNTAFYLKLPFSTYAKHRNLPSGSKNC